MTSTIAALSTPSGTSAVAVIRLSGPGCADLAKDIFHTEPKIRHATFSRYEKMDGGILDDVVYVYYKATASYTGEDMLELSPHGNPFIIREILDDLFMRGCSPAGPGEFTRRAFMNGKIDLTQAEAVALLIDARSQSALESARRQLRGELGKQINAISDELLDISASVEARIDFPEEDLPPDDTKYMAEKTSALAKKILNLAESVRYDHIVREGINIVIAGAPNAGKSSLLNSLLGNERAIVSPTAGTTRDFISESIILGGFRANMIDTAGLGHSFDDIEAAGMAKSVEKISSCDACIFTVDSSESPSKLPDLGPNRPGPNKTIVAVNKCDLPSSRPEIFEGYFKDFVCVKISCVTGSGIKSLKNALLQLIRKNRIVPDSNGIFVSARHAAALAHAGNSARCAARKILDSSSYELAASDLRDASDALGEIVGKSDNEEILDRIFSKFCIGK